MRLCTSRSLCLLAAAFLAAGLATAVGGCQPSRGLGGFIPNLFTVSVLPPEGGGSHTVEPGETVAVLVEVLMGVSVSGTSIEVILDSQDLPEGVHLDFGELSVRTLPNLEAGESARVTFNLVAESDAPSATVEIAIDAYAEITVEGETEGDFYEESTTLSLVVGDGGEPDGGEPDGGEPSSSCERFVEHYNALACTTEELVVENTCSESIREFCGSQELEDAFNECRIENTVCDGDELVEELDGCFAICGG